MELRPGRTQVMTNFTEMNRLVVAVYEKHATAAHGPACSPFCEVAS